MKYFVSTFVGLAMVFAVAQPLGAQPNQIDAVPLVLQFKLKVGAVLRRAITTQACDATIRFIGDGKAEVTRRHVTVKFDVLDAQGRRGVAVIRVDNPVGYTNWPSFAGRAKCKVRLPHTRFEFALALKGTIRRIGPHRWVMTGGFKTVRSSVDGAIFSGRFGGRNA